MVHSVRGVFSRRICSALTRHNQRPPAEVENVHVCVQQSLLEKQEMGMNRRKRTDKPLKRAALRHGTGVRSQASDGAKVTTFSEPSNDPPGSWGGLLSPQRGGTTGVDRHPQRSEPKASACSSLLWERPHRHAEPRYKHQRVLHPPHSHSLPTKNKTNQ